MTSHLNFITCRTKYAYLTVRVSHGEPSRLESWNFSFCAANSSTLWSLCKLALSSQQTQNVVKRPGPCSQAKSDCAILTQSPADGCLGMMPVAWRQCNCTQGWPGLLPPPRQSFQLPLESAQAYHCSIFFRAYLSAASVSASPLVTAARRLADSTQCTLLCSGWWKFVHIFGSFQVVHFQC